MILTFCARAGPTLLAVRKGTLGSSRARVPSRWTGDIIPDAPDQAGRRADLGEPFGIYHGNSTVL